MAKKSSSKDLEKYFEKFRKNVIGINQKFNTHYGSQTIHYFDWTASGRLYSPIEENLQKLFGPFVGNTHSESSETGVLMTLSYIKAKERIKSHVKANRDDVLIMTGTGTTGAINKLQRIMGLKVKDQVNKFNYLTKSSYKNHIKEKPVVFITHMEHHSNQTSWLEADVDLVVIPTDKSGKLSLSNLEKLLIKYKNRKIKIGSFSACSNVTGMLTPIHKLAKLMHDYDGYCFADFAAAAPYIDINMHPKNKKEKLDAIFFSPHKFLGGPGTPGVLIFSKDLYPNILPPDHPGGGTVLWTNPWGGKHYSEDFETREDGGTPGFLQTIKTALALILKEKMGTQNILAREHELLNILLEELRKIPEIHIMDDKNEERLGLVSFYIEDIHYNLIVKLLNDRFGIQSRGGCSCAGTYGHCLLNIDEKTSRKITDEIDKGNFSTKPGWLRISLHPIITNKEVRDVIKAIKAIIANIDEWKKDYTYDKHTNEYYNKFTKLTKEHKLVEEWFEKSWYK